MEKRMTLAVEEKEVPIEDIIVPEDEMPFPPLEEEMVEKIKETIVKYGLVYKPVAIPIKEGNRTKYCLIDGRSRLSALMKLGCKEIPCTVINALPEERKALYYVVECFRRHLPEDERNQAEDKLREIEEDLTVKLKEKIKSLLSFHGVPKNVASYIVNNIATEELAPLYITLDKNRYTLIPILKAVLETERFSKEDISQTQSVIEKLEQERIAIEKEKADLEKRIKTLLEEKQKSDNRIKELEQEVTLLEAEIAELKEQIAKAGQISTQKNVILDDPEVKKLIDRYVQERAKKEAEEIIKTAIKRATDEQAELQKRLNEILNERNKYLREKQELEDKIRALEKTNKDLSNKIKTWQDSTQFLKNILSKVVSVELILEEMNTVITRLNSIYISLTYLKGIKMETLQETHIYSLIKKYEEMEGRLRQIEKTINDIKEALNNKFSDRQAL